MAAEDVVWRSASRWEDARPTTVVVACSDARFRPYRREFMTVALGLPERTYYLIAVPGGPQVLAATTYLPKFSWVARQWFRFFAEKPALDRAVLIGHEDCSWYRDVRVGPARVMEEDLRAARAALAEFRQFRKVEAYVLARAGDTVVAREIG